MALGSAFRQPVIGLDIGSSGVKVVALRQSRSGWSLTAAAEAELESAEGTAASTGQVAGAVRRALDVLGMKRAPIAAALSGHAVIVKRLQLPAMSPTELAEAIPWEAEQYIPFELSDVQLDYQVLNAKSESAKTNCDVLLVAAKKDRIEDRTAVIVEAGRRPVVLDVEAFALVNAYRMNYPDRDDALAAIVHIGRSATIVCLLEHGELVFTRDIPAGGKLYLDILQRDLGVDTQTADRILRGQVPSDVSREQASTLLHDAGSQLILEIRKTVDFYRATAPLDSLSRVVISGGVCQAEGLLDLLHSEFNTTVEVFDPFRRVTRQKGTGDMHGAGPAYAVAVGLAMRREGDR
jgi:type IV pilus assembly protein PilM